MSEMWQLVHSSYGDELGLTSDDEDYVPPVRSTEATKVENNVNFQSWEIFFVLLLFVFCFLCLCF